MLAAQMVAQKAEWLVQMSAASKAVQKVGRKAAWKAEQWVEQTAGK